MRTGFTDEKSFQQASPEGRATHLARARSAASEVIRMEASWNALAPDEPPSRDQARDPLWQGYRFADLDTNVREVTRAGMSPLMLINNAPRWAEGADRPPVSDRAPGGTWRPSPTHLADFAVALARRYSGRTPDPLVPGGFLPRVREWQIWNEPNLQNFLTPQWKAGPGGRLVPASSGWYRSMLAAVYPALKAVARSNRVVTAGLAPFGDLKRGDPRIPPALFMRDFVCVRGRKSPKAYRCPGGPARFDALAAHPYPIGPPRRHAPNPDDVVVPDLDRLKKPLRVALKAGNVMPRTPKQLWATELSWDSKPDPDGLSFENQARYMSGAFYVLWRQGVDVVTWYLMRDEAEGMGYGFTLQSGIFLRGTSASEDRPKLSFTAFRFPFTAYLPKKGSRAQIWGLAPNAGKVVVEKQVGGRWRRVTRLRAGSGRVFTGRLRARRGEVLRARQAEEASLPWPVLR